MKKALRMCADAVIPSVFPFMIVSDLIISGSIFDRFGKILSKPCRTLFGISGVSSAALITGMLCGFPVGAKTVSSLLKNGHIDRSEAEHLMLFCNIPSPAFIITAVGVTMYGNIRIGIILYCSTLITALLSGILSKYFYPDKGTCVHPVIDTTDDRSAVRCFTDAVSSSALNMLTVCAYIVFFCTLVGCIDLFTARIGLSEPVRILISGLFEMTGGVIASSSMGTQPPYICLTAFILGWSGLSVHFQLMSMFGDDGIRPSRCFISKLIQGFVNSFITGIALEIFSV